MGRLQIKTNTSTSTSEVRGPTLLSARSAHHKRSGRICEDRGFTLIEAMIAIVVLAVGAAGFLSFQYHGARHTQIAQAQLSATRIARLVLEDWKSTGASAQYNPADLDLGFSRALGVPSGFSSPSGLGSTLRDSVFAIAIDELPMLVMLQSKDVAQDSVSDLTLRQLSVTVGFGSPSKVDIEKYSSLSRLSSMMSDYLANIPSITLSTYARIDSSGG